MPKEPTHRDLHHTVHGAQVFLGGLRRSFAVRPADIRRVAALMLFATYGFRLGEVARLTLDDVDWAHDVIRIRRSKRGDVQTYLSFANTGSPLVRD